MGKSSLTCIFKFTMLINRESALVGTSLNNLFTFPRLPVITSKSDQMMSGMEADSEGQGSGSKGRGKKDSASTNDIHAEAASASGPIKENAPGVVDVRVHK